MGKQQLSPEEKQQRKELSRNKTKERLAKKKKNGICRDCEAKVCKSSTVFCERHLSQYRKLYRKATKRHREKIGKYYSVKNRARERGIEICDQETFRKWHQSQQKECRYCGVQEDNLTSHSDKKQRSLTVDRMDNSRGYEVGNMCLACFRCNNMKSNFFTATEWHDICDRYIKPRLDEYHMKTES